MSQPCSPSRGGDTEEEIESQTQNKQDYTCRVCGVKLSRAAHLHRHQLQHSGPKETFQCHLCDKEFNRKDVYQRHLRVVHHPNRAAQRRSWKKSCQRCIRYKLKCNRETPCATCSRKQASCTYDAWSTRYSNRPRPHGEPEAQDDQFWDASGRDETYFGLAQGFSPVANFGRGNLDSYNEADASPSAALTSQAQLESPLSHGTRPNDHPSHIYGSSPHQSLQALEEDCSQSHPLTWNFHNSAMILAPAGQPHIEESDFPWVDNLSVDLEAFDSSMFRASKMDWLGCETDCSDQNTLPPLSGGDTRPVYDDPSPIREDIMTRSLSTGMQDVERRNGNTDQPHAQDVSSTTEGNETGAWPGILDRGGNELWPFDYESNKGFRKIKLPPLREIMEQTVGNNLPAIRNNTVKDLIKVLSAPMVPSLNDSPALEALPAVAFLGQLVKTYFAEFHPALSFIHTPSWRIEKCPSALLASMACIGATYSTSDGSEEIAALLAEITQRSLFWMGQADSRSYRNPEYIAASCLHQIYSLGSGNRRLYELADASRGLLVTGLRELGVLSSDTERSENHKIDFQNLKKLSDVELEQAWNRWRDSEIERRVAWSVFEFDCALSTLTGRRSAFSISELPRKLPCAESLWEAPSANAWASVIMFSTSPPDGIPFYPLIRIIISSRRGGLKSVPSWARRICALVISRLLWDLRELEDASSSDILGLCALADSHKAAKENLLASLMSVSDSLSNPTCTHDIINMNIACLTAHFAHISGDETMDLVTFIFRNNYGWNHGSSSSQLNKELKRAREHLRLRFSRNPVATRRAVRHAALIIGTSQECTSFTPCETMRVFFSFAFILAFARFFPFEEQSAINFQSDTQCVKLDEISFRRSTTNNSASCVQKWIENGGPASLGPVGDICQKSNFVALKDHAVQAMEDLRVWGLASKFRRILKSFKWD